MFVTSSPAPNDIAVDWGRLETAAMITFLIVHSFLCEEFGYHREGSSIYGVNKKNKGYVKK